MQYKLLKRQLKWYFIMFTTCFLQVVAVSSPPWVHGTMEHFKVKLVCCVISVWSYACIYMIAATSVVYFIVLYSIFNIQILTIKKTKILALSLLQCFFHLLGIFPPHISRLYRDQPLKLTFWQCFVFFITNNQWLFVKLLSSRRGHMFHYHTRDEL